MFRLFFFFLFFVQPSFSDDLLEILDSKTSTDFDAGKEALELEKIVKNPTKEQKVFFELFVKDKYERAFYQWLLAFDGTNFSKSHTGQALYSFLLFKNKMPLTALDKLFSLNPKELDPALINLWQFPIQFKSKIWTGTDLNWSSGWAEVFGTMAQTKALVFKSDKETDLAQTEELLRKTSPKTMERHWIQWKYITGLLLEKDIKKNIKAAKLLKNLKTVEQNNPVSKDLMDLTIARMLYQNGYLKESLSYYKKVKKGSDYWFSALEEMAWVELRLGSPQNALAYTKTLLDIDFNSDISPDVFYLSSLSSLKVCDYVSSAQTIKKFKNRFKSKAENLLKVKKSPESPALEKLFEILSSKVRKHSSLAMFSNHLPRFITHDQQLYFLVQRQNQLEKELKIAENLESQLKKMLPKNSSKAIKKNIKKRVKAIYQTNRQKALDRVKELVDQEILEISQTVKKMQILEVELTQQISLLLGKIENNKKESVHSSSSSQKQTLKGTTGSKDKYAMTFVYQNEKWYDELSNYKVDISACH